MLPPREKWLAARTFLFCFSKMDPVKQELLAYGFSIDRSEFRNLIGKEIQFTATVSQIGHRPKSQSKKLVQTCLLTGITVTYEESHFEIDHLWVDKKATLKGVPIGKFCHGKAVVAVYERANGSRDFNLRKVKILKISKDKK